VMSSPGSSPHSPLSAMNKKVQRLICNGVRNGEEIRFDDALEASRYAESLEQGSWARVYADVDREAEHAHYMKQAKLICSKINVDPTK